MKKILLNARKNDPHAIGISNELKKLGENYTILDNFTINDNFYVEYLNGISKGEIQIRDEKISLDQIKSVWNTSPLSIKIIKELSEETKNFVKAEWTEGISSLWNSITAKWINHPTSILNAVNRLNQLKLGTEVGFDTPKTNVTNNPKILNEFFYDCNEEVIAKTLHSSEGLPDDKMIFTTKISKQDLERSKELQYAPCMFQEYIPKKTELRVTIIGDVIRTAEIHSQKSEKTKHDWRQYDDFEKTPYEIGVLPNDIEESLLKLMKLMNLEFGAADFIRTPDDEYVFLEINPNGRWWWIQELTGMNIARDIALHLSN
jgi:glutathione synthase/RimK-type ligase-like ATP-grasp enzyme